MVNEKYSICSFGEIITELLQKECDCFLIIYSVPWANNIETLYDAKRKSQCYVRFINTKSPYTYNLKEIFMEISVFIGQIVKDLESELGYMLNPNQQEYLNLFPKSLSNLFKFSPLLLEIMKHKIEIEINSNLLQRRELLYVFLMAVEKDNLSEESMLTMMDQLLDLVNNILNNLCTKGSSNIKNLKSHFGNFVFDKNVLVLTQNTNIKKKRDKGGAEMADTISKNQDFIGKQLLSSRLSPRKLSSQQQVGMNRIKSHAKKLSGPLEDALDSRRNTVSFLLKN